MPTEPAAADPAGAELMSSSAGAAAVSAGGRGGARSLAALAPRSRPCDTCRTRKTRCVRAEGQLRCVLCTFHNQPCTFLRGPTARNRRARERDATGSNDYGEVEPPSTDAASHVAADEPPWPAAPRSDARSLSGSSVSGTDAQSPPAAATAVNQSQFTPGLAATMPMSSPAQDSTRESRPEILSNTLGLDLETHADYIGSTDYRDPVLLDLHRPSQSVRRDQLMPSFVRRLDHRSIFLVHADESSASEAQRIKDLDAIEDTVRPLGRTLVDLYFRIVHPSFPILHKDVFISKHRVSHRHFAPSLLAAVYLVALDWQLYDSSLAGREMDSIPNSAALEALAEQTIAQDIRRPKLSTLEAGLLLLQRSRRVVESGSHPHQSSSRLLTAQLVTMAQDLGIHLDCSSWSIPAWEVGLRRRLAWALYMQDRWGGCVNGRPFLIQDSDWGVQPCTEMDYPELAGADNTGRDMHSAISVGWEVFLRHIELSKILNQVIGTFYVASACRTGGLLDQMGIVAMVELAKPLVLQLREWHSALPQQLKLENSNPRELCANAALHLAHLAVEVLLYRALVRSMTPDTPESLHAALRTTARAKVQDGIDLLGSLRPEHTAAFWGGAAAYQTAQVGSLASLLWATAESQDEISWCVARIEDLRWALRVRGAAAPFAREALRLLERDIGGLGVVK